MEYRNAQFTADGKIDCEVNHRRYGWIPYTASETDSEESGREQFELMKNEAAPYVAPQE